VQRTKAALQQTESKTIKTWKYDDDGSGIVLDFGDGTNLQIDITYEHEIVGVQNEPCLMVHFGGRGSTEIGVINCPPRNFLNTARMNRNNTAEAVGFDYLPESGSRIQWAGGGYDFGIK
jgi:hypothetical protein